MMNPTSYTLEEVVTRRGNLPPRVKCSVTKHLELLPGQREFMECTSDSLLYSGAFGAGKTRVVCEKAFFLSMLYPGNFGLVVRKVFKTLRLSTLWVLLNKVIPRDVVADHNKVEHLITLKTGVPGVYSHIAYAGIDDPEKLGSFTGLGFVAVDEAIELDEADWRMLEGRLRLSTVPFHQIFGATNPGHPQHFLHNEFYQGAYPRKKAAAWCVESNAFENRFNPESFKKRLQRFKGRYRERYALGKWVGFEGLVYPEFNPSIHVIQPREIPTEWTRWITIDFGFVHPLVVQWWAEDPETGALHRYRLIYRTHLRTESMADMVAGHTFQDGVMPQYIVTDHNPEAVSTMKATWAKFKEQRKEAEEKKKLAEIETDEAVKADLETQAEELERMAERNQWMSKAIIRNAEKDVTEGIQEVTSLLAVDADTGHPRLLFHDEALVHDPDPALEENDKPFTDVDEFGGYQFKKTKGGYDERPEKINDDGMDATRYLALTRRKIIERAALVRPVFKAR